MTSQCHVEFMQAFGELSLLSRRDITQSIKLARYKKKARSMLNKDPVCGNTLLGLVACFEHDIEAMHACHKKAIELSESCFSLIHYAVSLERSCLWNESAKYALLALDLDPGNLNILDAIIRLAPLTGRFSLLKRLLPQWRTASGKAAHPYQGDCERVGEILARHGLLEKDLKPVLAAIGDILSQTNVTLKNFKYETVNAGEPSQNEVSQAQAAPFLHFRFAVPDEFVATYYEDIVDAGLSELACHPRLFDAFSFAVENAAVYELYDCMDKEIANGADTVRVPDPEKMKLIEELIADVELPAW